MDNERYRQYLEQYVREAIRSSDGTNRGAYTYLSEIEIKGLIVRHREEKTRALNDARQAFDEHRHWPREILLSHLGVTLPD